MEVLVGDHRLDPLKTHVRRDVGVRQHAGGVEDIQTLILHGSHIEIVHRYDVVELKVIFETIDLLVPSHRCLQRVHRMIAVADIFLLHPNVQIDRFTRACNKLIANALEIPCHHGEQVTGFGERVVPDGSVTTALKFLFADQITVAEQNGAGLAAGLEGHCIHRENIRPVRKIRNLAKSFRLALCAVGALRAIKPLQRGVVLRADINAGAKGASIGHRLDHQLPRLYLVLSAIKSRAIKLHPL